MGSHSAVLGKGPEAFRFAGSRAIIGAQEREIQDIINYFKSWLPQVSRVYEYNLRREKEEAETAEHNRIKQEIEEKERRLRVLNTVKI
jgi:biopolymer transport protein ExbB/TolQ